MSDDLREPFLVERGWIRSIFIPHTGGESYRILIYTNGTWRFEHRCRRPHITVICAPALQLDNGGHRVAQSDPLTIEPSILCPDCGTHGFIRNGRWVEA